MMVLNSEPNIEIKGNLAIPPPIGFNYDFLKTPVFRREIFIFLFFGFPYFSDVCIHSLFLF